MSNERRHWADETPATRLYGMVLGTGNAPEPLPHRAPGEEGARADLIRRALLALGILGLMVGIAATSFLHGSGGAAEGPPVSVAAGVAGGGPGESGWRLRDATRTRHEIHLRSFVSRGEWEQARDEALSLLRLDPFHDEARSLLRRAQATLDGGPDDVAATAEPSTGRRSARAVIAYESARREVRKLHSEAIDRSYPDPIIAASIRRYALDGTIEAALDDLRARAGEMEDAEAAELLVDRLRRFASSLKDGHAAMAAGRLIDADASWGLAFAIENSLLPAEVASVAVRDARTLLGKAWYEEGARHAARYQWEEASAAWRRGQTVDPSHLELRVALQRLEERRAAGGAR